MSELFIVNVGLRQGYVMSQWLSIAYMDVVMWEVIDSVLGRGLEQQSTVRENTFQMVADLR